MVINGTMRTVTLFPFEGGGDFRRARGDPYALLAELRAEREEIRSRKRQVQEMISMRSRQIEQCIEEETPDKHNSFYGWLTGAAAAFIFGLLFSSGVMCGSCGRFGLSGFCILIGVILCFRALSEYRYLANKKKNKTSDLDKYVKECEKYNAQLYRLNLREAELDESIRSAQKYL